MRQDLRVGEQGRRRLWRVGGKDHSGSRGWREDWSKVTRRHSREQGSSRLNRLGEGSGFASQGGGGCESSGPWEVSRASKKEQQELMSCGS